MEKFGNDIFKYNGKLYKVVKKEMGHRCSDTCPLYNYGRCGNICSVMYNQLKNPEFTYEDVVLVEVAPGEAEIKNDEIDYKALYEETISKLKIAKENVGYYTFSEVIDKVIPEVAESEDERIRKALIKYLEALDDEEIRYGVSFKEMRSWLEKHKEQKPAWSEEDNVKLNDVVRIIENSGNVKSIIEHYVNWLKSIKDRITLTNKNDFDRGYEVGISAAKFNQWKPTKEQLEALEWSLGDYRNVIFEERHDTLTSLYNDLKKL